MMAPSADGLQTTLHDTSRRRAADRRVRRIAIVDDDTIWLDLVALGLTRRGYEVATFERGQEILESPWLRGADLMILDYHLPDLDGVSLCEAIHEVRPTVPTILVTGDKQRSVVVAALHRGFDDYLQKPVTLEVLELGIRRLFDQPHAGSRKPGAGDRCRREGVE